MGCTLRAMAHIIIHVRYVIFHNPADKSQKKKKTYTSDDANGPNRGCGRGTPGIRFELLRKEGGFEQLVIRKQNREGPQQSHSPELY